VYVCGSSILGWSDEEGNKLTTLPLLLDRRRLVLVYRLNFFQMFFELYILLIANSFDCKASTTLSFDSQNAYTPLSQLK